MGSSKTRWARIKTSFATKTTPKTPPTHFLCPILNTLMADPVIISSGQTFERNSIVACQNLKYIPSYSSNATSTKLNLSAPIPNLSFQETILNWFKTHGIGRPKAVEVVVAENIVKTLMVSKSDVTENRNVVSKNRCDLKKLLMLTNDSKSSISISSMSSSVSSENSPVVIGYETLMPSWADEEEGIFLKLKNSSQVYDQEELLVYIRKITRIHPETRAPLCSSRVLMVLRSLLTSRYSSVQVNAVAVLVNFSLEMANKVKIVRAGLLPLLITTMKYGFVEAQEHAVAAVFSLALEDQNKTVIGVLGTLPPLLRFTQSKNEQVQSDAIQALYHISLDQSNRSKIVKLGAVPMLLADPNARNVRILMNLIMCVEGCMAMIDIGAVKCFFEILKGNNMEKSRNSTESCVTLLYILSCRSLRFKVLAKEVEGENILMRLTGLTRQGQEKVQRMLELIQAENAVEGENEEVDWESILYSSEAVKMNSRPNEAPPEDKPLQPRKEKEVIKKDDLYRPVKDEHIQEKETELSSLLNRNPMSRRHYRFTGSFSC